MGSGSQRGAEAGDVDEVKGLTVATRHAGDKAGKGDHCGERY